MNKQKWMDGINDKLTLKEICIPGSHDAGMYYHPVLRTLNFGLPLLGKFSDIIFTQGLDTRGQLENGIRYFDVRPMCTGTAERTAQLIQQVSDIPITAGIVEQIANALGIKIGDFVAHHGVGWGMRIVDMVKAAADFVMANPSEVVIFNFSHFENFAGVDDKFIQELLQNLKPAQRLDIPYGRNLTKLPLWTIRGKVILVLENDGMYRNAVRNKGIKGIYQVGIDGEFPLYDKYSNKNSYKEMVTNQMCKFGKYNGNQLFMLNWTMTPTLWALAPIKLGIEGYAQEINPRLLGYGHAPDFLLQRNYYGQIVNIINGDYWEKSGDDVIKACLKVMDNRERKQTVTKLVSKAGESLKLVPISEYGQKEEDGKCNYDTNHSMYQTWYMKRLGDNVYRLQNAGSGLYLRAATDGFWASIFCSRDNNLVPSLQEDGDGNLNWHFEDLGNNTFHIVASARKNNGIKEDRLDASGGNLYLHKPNDGNFQKWVASKSEPL